MLHALDSLPHSSSSDGGDPVSELIDQVDDTPLGKLENGHLIATGPSVRR